MNQLKKATSILKELRDHQTHDRERDLAEKRAAFGQTLPDIRTWEEYISNPDHLTKFHEQLGVMENATKEEIVHLEEHPGSSQFTFDLLLFFLRV